MYVMKVFIFIQAEEDSLLFQQYAAAEDNGLFEGRLRPYVDQVRMVWSLVLNLHISSISWTVSFLWLIKLSVLLCEAKGAT